MLKMYQVLWSSNTFSLVSILVNFRPKSVGETSREKFACKSVADDAMYVEY